MHTILILDKALHGFPWESLPCLKGLSLSRLPSLACLRERLLLQQNDENQTWYDGHHISRESGTYILNPSGDLENTESTFSSAFAGLKDWTSIVGRAPTETEIELALSKAPLYLYFGHGGGEQYIRARSVKRLEKCAVSILMGCSSGALVDTVEFEPYGTPRNYMLAGCPALVATLWDVTDKDIDRFAQDVFGHWGLFGEPKETKSAARKGGKRREKEKAADDLALGKDSHGKINLTEAVARSRDSCVLRYLNGAAPVVYGIPVYLD
jgi:separase